MNKYLERIVVKELFDTFDYDIDLKNGSDVAILTAPNGCGKTTVFKIVDFMFKPSLEKYEFVCSVPFKSCECYLSNGNKVKLCFENSKPVKADDFEYETAPFTTDNEIPIPVNSSPDMVLLISSVRGRSAKGIFNLTVRIQTLKANYKYYDYDLPFGADEPYNSSSVNIELFKEVSNVFKNSSCDMNVEFISADRLYKPLEPKNKRKIESDNPLTVACDEIRTTYLEEAREKFYELQSAASDALPKKYLLAKKSKVTLPEFKKRWNAYTGDLRKFCEIGLIEPAENVLSDEELDKAYEDKREFLNVYLETFDKTLEPLRKEYDKMKLFRDIFNGRNKGTGKKMEYGKEGLEIAVGKTKLDVNKLSSGEKHEFIMFYDLIFKTTEGSLVLIDEPEISLHISWQEEFINKLLTICKINGFKALVATHSPNIINEHFDLMVER